MLIPSTVTAPKSRSDVFFGVVFLGAFSHQKGNTHGAAILIKRAKNSEVSPTLCLIESTDIDIAG